MSKVYVIKDGGLYMAHAYTASPRVMLLDKVKNYISKLHKCKITDIHVDMLDDSADSTVKVKYMIRQTNTKVYSRVIPRGNL